nr:MAG TPA: crystallin beta/gamma motif-containing protein [Caudoviricetes sp.]
MSDYKITPEQATNGTFSVRSHANVKFEGGVQQEVTDNSYGKAISNAASGVSDWLTKDPSTATVDMNAMNALTQTDVTPQQSENFVNKAGEILQPVMHRAEQIYLWNKADWAQSAYDSGEALGISPDLIMASGQDGIRRAEAAAAQINRGKTLNEVYELYPELVGINYKNSAEAITTLQNLQSVKDTYGVWDSIQQSTWAINDQIKLGKVGMELSTATDPKRIQELNDEVERLQSNLSKYRKADEYDVLETVAGATASQAYMMAAQAIMGSNRAAEGMALGAAVGAAATAPAGGSGAIPAALVGLNTGIQVGMAEQMYQMSFGNKYLELIQKRDANGNQVYSNEEARKYAMSYAAIDAGIEFVATKAIGKGITNVAPKSALAKVITNGTTDVAATFDRGIGTTVAQMAKNSIKAGVPELFEEGFQDINEKVQHNLTRKDNDLEGYYSVGDIAIGSLDAMKQALPAVIGFGAIGGAVGGVRTAKAFRDFQKLTPEQQQAAIIAEQNRNGAVIMDNVRKDSTTNKIAKENPELYGKIVQAQGDKIGVSTQYVDVAELVQSENGQLAIRDMVDNGLVTQEEVKAAIEADAPVEIPIGSYAQVSMNLSDETVDALKQTSYFTRGGMSLATLERAKQEVDVAKSVLKDDTSKRAERIKDDIIRNEFEGASDIDREVLNEVLSDPTNIKRNFNNLLHTLKEQYRETYASDFDNADKSINDAVSTGIEPQWLTDYKANNGGKAPRTNAERRRAAYEYSRATTTASLDGNADALAQSDAHYADMEHMLMQIESLEAMKDKVFEIADNNVALRMNLTKSGHEVYTKVRELLETSTKGHIKQQAHEDALLVATHADVFAQIMREAGNARYTAMDYLNTVRFDINAKLNGKDGYAQAAWHGSPYDFDEFDLGGIGGGLGTQAFGWGLYFAEKRSVAEKYKVERKSKNKFTLKGNDIPIEYAPVIEQIFGGINVENNKETLLNRLVMHRDAEQSNLDIVAKNLNELDGVLDFITQNNKLTISKLPTLVDNKLERMATVILNDAKVKAKSDNKRVNKEYLFDAIEEERKKYNKHYIFYNDIVSKISYLIDNIDSFEVTSVYKPTLYNVEVPDTDTMLDYSKPIKEQSEYVLEKIKQLELTDTNITGKEFYNDLSERLGSDKKASLKLNELGIKGIRYKQGLTHNFVVFDDKSIQIIEKYNQSINGMTTIKSKTERIVELFKTADKSTFMHEMGHVFFDDIKTLAEMENAPQQVKDDWQALKEWSGWNDNETINTDAHEKFARGFEAYLREGEAPTKFLERTFRRFSKWLSAIYRAVSRLGGLPPKEIRGIMDRMLATQEDIEAYAEQQQLEQFEKTELYKQLSEQDQARMQSYIADVKEKAKERVMRKLMKELDNRPIKEWEEEKDAIQIEIEKRLIEQYPIYKEHQRYNVFGAGALKDTQYNSIEKLEKAEVEQTGATFNDAINQEMDNAKAEFMRDNNVGKTNEQIAEEILLSTQGQMKLTEEESKIIQQSTNRELAKNWELLERIRKLDPNAETIDTELSEIEKEVKPTKYDILKSDKKKVDAALVDTTKELEKAERLIEKLNNEKAELTDKARERESELKDKNSELSKRLTTITNQLDRAIEQKERLAERNQERVEKQELKASERIEKLKDELQDRINNVRSIRGAGLGTISDYMNRARKELGELPISNAVQFKTYQNKAVTAGKKADRALASGKVDKALGYKREQMLQQARARVAFENFEKSKKLRLKLKQQLQRMTRPKNPIAIEPNMRYFYAHMAYQMGLTKYDGLAPTDGFDMNTVLSALDVDALILNQQSMVQLQPWIAEMFYAKTPKSFKSITMNELETLEELMTGMYKNGRNEYEGTTILNDAGDSVSFDDAVNQIIGEATKTFGGATGEVFNILNNQSKTDAVSGKLYGFHLALMKVETFLRRMGGGKNGFAVKYIYDPISRATQAFNERKEVSMRRLAKDVGIYSKRELFDMRNDHLYTVGELYGLTKEQLIMIALNWGTESNRQRVMETTKANEVEIERAFQEHMTDKDWEFVIRTWDHINSFFDERSRVQEELYGNPLKKVKGLTFSIGGRNIEGQYFPIVYNPKVNASVSDNQVEDIAKTMVSSNAVWGTGMSATKSRLDVVKDKSLLLDFDVIPNAITEAINHVTMRKAVTDVNKLISNRELQNYIVDKFGADTYQFLRTWVRDNWQDEPAKTNDFDRLILTLKKNTNTAVMVGRVSVALQNALNIPVAFYRIGVGNTIRAINHAGIGFYGHGTTTYNNTRDFVLEHSIFMRERVQTLDKDLKQGLSIGGKGLRLGDTNVGGYKVEQLADIRDDINQMGFRLLTETDFALSIPVWKFAYDQKQAELIGKEGVSLEWIEQQSIEAGDRAVRDIFGSGDTKDAAAIQRARSSIMQMFIPFYSYANTLYNIITEGNYARKDTGDYARFVKVLWWTLVVPAIGMMAYKAMTNGDDDKPEDLAKSFIEELVAQGTMGVPLVRDITNMAMKFILGERPYNKGNTVLATSIAEKFFDVSNAIVSDKKDGIDVGRSFSQLANRATGFSDTVTDGLWTLARYAFTDTDAAIEDVIMAIMFDRRLKTKKDKKKH